MAGYSIVRLVQLFGTGGTFVAVVRSCHSRGALQALEVF